MDFILTQKFKLIFILLFSVVSFAYFKYIKRIDMGWKIGLSIEFIILAISCIAASLSYPTFKVANFIFLREEAPSQIERYILIGYCFLLVGLMSLIDAMLNRVFKLKKMT